LPLHIQDIINAYKKEFEPGEEFDVILSYLFGNWILRFSGSDKTPPWIPEDVLELYRILGYRDFGLFKKLLLSQVENAIILSESLKSFKETLTAIELYRGIKTDSDIPLDDVPINFLMSTSLSLESAKRFEELTTQYWLLHCQQGFRFLTLVRMVPKRKFYYL